MKASNPPSNDLFMTPSEYQAWSAEIIFKRAGEPISSNQMYLYRADAIVRRRPKINPYTFVSKLDDNAAHNTMLRLFHYLEAQGLGQILQAFLAEDMKVYNDVLVGSRRDENASERPASELNVIDLLKHLQKDRDD